MANEKTVAKIKHQSGGVSQKQIQDFIDRTHSGRNQSPPHLNATAPAATLEEMQEKSKVINLLNATQAQDLKHFMSLGVRQDGTLFVGTTTNDMGIVEDMLSAVAELAAIKTVKSKDRNEIEAKMKERIKNAATQTNKP